MKQHLPITRLLSTAVAALPLAVLLNAPVCATAQTPSYAIPFITTIAGLATGSGNTLCTSGYYKNIGGVNTGDGCPATQASLNSLYDTQVDSAGNIYTSENGTYDDVRVIYRGGAATAALLTAANAAVPNFTLVPGNIYTLAGASPAPLPSRAAAVFSAATSREASPLSTARAMAALPPSRT